MLRSLAFFVVFVLFAAPLCAEERAVPSGRDEVLLSYGPVVEQVAQAVVNV